MSRTTVSHHQVSDKTIEVRSTTHTGFLIRYSQWIWTGGKRVKRTNIFRTSAQTALGALIRLGRDRRAWQGRYAQYEVLSIRTTGHSESVYVSSEFFGMGGYEYAKKIRAELDSRFPGWEED